MVLVLTGFAFVASRLYPWASPIEEDGRTIPPGPSSVVHTVASLEVTGHVVLVMAVLILGVLLRPFQISLVQVLEGYWSSRGIRGALAALGSERHVRQRSRHALRLGAPKRTGPRDTSFEEVAAYSRRRGRAERLESRAQAVTDRYVSEVKEDPERGPITLLMPTLLGNVLRRSELTAGERYGLTTVITYPRLYPHLSEHLRREIASHLDAIDTSAAFTVVLAAQAVLAMPLIARLDGWSLLPAALLLLAIVPYRGAIVAASRHGVLLATAYDLHRFDMLASMHMPLPRDRHQERIQNERLSIFLTNGEDATRGTYWTYRHDPTSLSANQLDFTPGTEHMDDDRDG
jgi:hypothetical protein